LTKKDLAGELAKSVGELTRAGALEVLGAFFNAIQSGLSRGEKIAIVGFGSFEVRQRAARKGRNPQKPEEEIDIPAGAFPVFRAGKALKDAVNPRETKKKGKK
jgi:DNA-binding protein HU-beta